MFNAIQELGDDRGEPLRSESTASFGRVLKKHRRRRGMTQRQLADLATLSIRAIRDLERDRVRRPRAETVRLIAKALSLDPTEQGHLENLVRTVSFSEVQEERTGGEPPLALSPIIAREVECDAIVETLSDGSGRLASIAGLPGIGKTRVALEVAFRLYQREGCTVMWAAGPRSAGSHGLPEGDRELRKLPERLAGSIFGRSRGELSDTAHREVAEVARENPVLLVLDGTGAGGRPDRDVLTGLLKSTPNLRVLGTARASYRVPGEYNFVLGPLSVPTRQEERSRETLNRVASVRLFLSRMALSRPEYRLTQEDLPVVGEICRRSDGIPLFLESLAPWMAVYDLPELLAAVIEAPLELLSLAQNCQSGRGSYAAALERIVHPLSTVQLDMLSWLSEHGPSDLFRVGNSLGTSTAESREWMRSLVVSGLVRTEQRNDRTEFCALHVVKDLLRRREQDRLCSPTGRRAS